MSRHKIKILYHRKTVTRYKFRMNVVKKVMTEILRTNKQLKIRDLFQIF